MSSHPTLVRHEQTMGYILTGCTYGATGDREQWVETLAAMWMGQIKWSTGSIQIIKRDATMDYKIWNSRKGNPLTCCVYIDRRYQDKFVIESLKLINNDGPYVDIWKEARILAEMVVKRRGQNNAEVWSDDGGTTMAAWPSVILPAIDKKTKATTFSLKPLEPQQAKQPAPKPLIISQPRIIKLED